jgi:shikimate kinase
MNIVLIGFMGTGKSAVGNTLAGRLSCRWLDTDHEIENRFGKSVRRIFSEDGQDAFRAMETELLEFLSSGATEAVQQKRMPDYVLSTGGGTPLREENVKLLRAIGTVVWLTASPELILKRVERNLGQRPLLSSHQKDPLARIKNLLAEREEAYAKAADYRIDTTGFARPSNTALKIITMLRLNEEQ